MTETVTVEKEVYESVLRVNCNKIAECERLQKQLEIAIKALRGVRVWANTGNGGEQAVKKLCDKALKEIEELN